MGSDRARAAGGPSRLAPLVHFVGPLLLGGVVGLAPVLRAALAHADSPPSPPGAIVDSSAAAPVAPPPPAPPLPPSAADEHHAAPSIALLGVDASGVWHADANDGKLDEILQLSSTGAAKAKVRVTISEARPTFASVDNAPLSLAYAGRPTRTSIDVELEPGGVFTMPLSGTLVRPASYVAELRVVSTEPTAPFDRVVRMQIHATAPPLGLRATDLQPEPRTAFPGRPVVVGECIGVDTPPPAAGARVAVGATGSPSSGAHHFPDPKITLTSADCPPGTAWLQFPPLGAGRYEGVLDVQGEKLTAVVIVRHPWFMAVLAVMFGAFLTVASRELVRYFKQRTENEELIDVERPPALASALDRQLSHNALRRARGSNVLFLMENVARELKGVARPERAAVAAIQVALDAEGLPSPAAAPLRSRFSDVLALSSIADQPDIERGLVELSRGATTNFRRGVADWLRSLEAQIDACKERIDAAEEPAQVARRGRARTALWVLEQLASDATWLVSHDDRRPECEHVELLADVPTRLEELATWVERGPDDATVAADVAFAQRAASRRLPDVQKEIAATRIEIAAEAVADLSIVERVVSMLRPTGAVRVRALTEVTLRATPALPSDVGANLRFTWRIEDEGRSVEIVGGPRLTYVFASAGLARRVTVACHRPGVVVEACTFPAPKEGDARLSQLAIALHVAPAARSRTRMLSWLTDQASSFVFALIAGLVAVAVYWDGKGFGDPADYMALVTAGIGVDFSVGSVRKLLPGPSQGAAS